MDSVIGLNKQKHTIFYGTENNSILDFVCALAFALMPILQHYVGIIENAGFSVMVFLVGPLLLLKTGQLLIKGETNRKCLMAILPLILFEAYTIVVRGFNMGRTTYGLFLIWFFVCMGSGAVNISYFFRCAKGIATVATLAVFVQYVSHYVFLHDIQLRPLSWLVNQDSIWIHNAERYVFMVSLYRPTAFFLEPSHFFIYVFPVITVLLLSEPRTKHNVRRAVLLSIGMFLTLSGMGLAFVIGIWLLYFMVYRNGSSNSNRAKQVFNPRNIIIFVITIALIILAYRFVPVFRQAIERVFVEDEENYSAIDGRVRLARSYVQEIRGSAVLFGRAGIVGDLDFNLAGFYATFIKWGVFGLFFTYWFYGQGLFKLKGAYFWLSVILIIISFFTAHTHGTFYLMYYVLFLMNGYYERSVMESNEVMPSTENVVVATNTYEDLYKNRVKQ